MATNLSSQAPNQSALIFPFEPTEYDRHGEIVYPEQRETDMGETLLYYKIISYFWNALTTFLAEREDVFVAANMNLYYEKDTPQKWYAPDILAAFGVENYDRSSYRVWQEGIFPQVIFEVASERTWDNDIGGKYRFYEEFGVEEYYVLDPEFAFLPAPMMAYHRDKERLLLTNITDRRIFSPRLGLEIVQNEQNFRLFNPQTNEFLRTLTESEREITESEQRANTEIERLKAEIERLKAQK